MYDRTISASALGSFLWSLWIRDRELLFSIHLFCQFIIDKIGFLDQSAGIDFDSDGQWPVGYEICFMYNNAVLFKQVGIDIFDGVRRPFDLIDVEG